MKISSMTPTGDMVLVKLVNLEAASDGLITAQVSDVESVAPRYGEVIAIGENVDSVGHCTGLSVGEIAIFTEFAGYHVVSDSADEMYKLVRAYDVIGKCMTQEDIDKLDLTPTENRVMVESFNIYDEGIILDNAKDPRSLDLNYGKVIKIGKNVKNKSLRPGATVAFADYVGTSIREYESDDSPAVSILVEEDILLTIT